MADATCKKVRELLTDARGGSEALPADAQRHLAACRDCASFAALVASIAARAHGAAPDYGAADLALARAQVILRKRRAAGELALFIASATAVSAAVVAAGASGFLLPVLVYQGLAFVALPFVGYALLRKRTRGGAVWTT